jgi:hypothetical protein
MFWVENDLSFTNGAAANLVLKTINDLKAE